VSNPPFNIGALVRQAQDGDNHAVGQLYEIHVERIYRYIVYRVPEQDAEDLTAEVFTNMIESLPRYEERGIPFEAWLYRIAAARVADYHRARSRNQQVELSEQLAQDDPQPEETILQAQERETLRKALANLNEDERKLILLRFVERKSHAEVAEILGKSENAVKVMQHRALSKTAKHLGLNEKGRSYLRGQTND